MSCSRRHEFRRETWMEDMAVREVREVRHRVDARARETRRRVGRKSIVAVGGREEGVKMDGNERGS